MTTTTEYGSRFNIHTVSKNGMGPDVKIQFAAVDGSGQTSSTVSINVFEHTEETGMYGGHLTPTEARALAIALLQSADEADAFDAN